jgi:hypothetical protein
MVMINKNGDIVFIPRIRREKIEDGQWWFRGPDILVGYSRVRLVIMGSSSLCGPSIRRVRIPKFHGGIAYAYLFNDLHKLNPNKWSLEVFHSILNTCEDRTCHTPSTTSVYGYPKTHQVGDIPGYPIKPEVVEDPSVYDLPDFYEGWLRPAADNQGPTLGDLVKAAQEAGMEVSLDVTPRDGGGTFAVMDVETQPPYTGVAEPDPRTLDEAAKEVEARMDEQLEKSRWSTEQPDPTKVRRFTWKADPEVGALFDGAAAVRSSLVQRVGGVHKGISDELHRLSSLLGADSSSSVNPFEVALLYVDRFRRELLRE